MVIHKLNSALNAAPAGRIFFGLRTRRDDSEVLRGQSAQPASPQPHGSGGVDVQGLHRLLWVHDTDDRQTVAFTPTGMDYLREMLPQYKRNRPDPRP
jgi:hypothetical protein